MAAFGQGINAGLGAVNYAPYQQGVAQGAQMRANGAASIGQGIANLGGGIAQGIEQAGARAEKEKSILQQAAGQGKALQGLAKSLEELGIAPAGLTAGILQAQESMAPREFVAYSQQISSGLSDLIKGGVEMQQLKTVAAQQRAQMEQQRAKAEVEARAEAMKGTVEQVANMIALGVEPPQGVYTPDVLRSAQVEAMRIRKDTSAAPQQITKGDEIVTINPVTGEELATAPRTPLPAGYQRTAGGMAPVPGSEAAMQQEGAAAKTKAAEEQAKARKEATIATIGGVRESIKEASGMVNAAAAGATGFASAKVPATPAYNLSKKLETIKANIGFDRLQQMREASPTGGALGQVAVQELTALQATIASLDQFQSPAQLKSALKKVDEHYSRWERAVKGDETVVKESKSAGPIKVGGFMVEASP